MSQTTIKLECTCEHGCRNCGQPASRMSSCPAWDPCPVGRALTPTCPVHGEEDRKTLYADKVKREQGRT